MMVEGEIPGSLWSSSSSPIHDNFHQSESWFNLLLLVQQLPSFADSAAQVVDSEAVITGTNQLQSSNSAAQDVDFEEEEEEDAVTGTNSDSKLRSGSFVEFMAEQLPPLDSALEHEITKSKSTLPMALPHPHAVDFNIEHAYYKSRPEISCATANQVNQQFNVVNNTQLQPPIANTNVFQFTAKVIKNSDEAKRQKRKQANLKSARQSRKRRQDLMKNIEIEVEHLKKTASELSLACSERKENCDTSHCWNRVAIIDRVTIIARVYTSEKQLMRVTGFHPLDDPVFISIAENAGLNLSDARSLIHAPTYLTSQIPPYLIQRVSTFSNAPHPQEQQVQNQNFLNIGLHGAMPGWDNNQQKKY